MKGRIKWGPGQPRKAMTEFLVQWKPAVARAENGDNTLLADLLMSDLELGPDARELIAKLLRQRPFGRKRGRPETPITRMTESQAHLWHLRKRVEDHLGRRTAGGQRVNLDTAIELALWEDEEEPFKPGTPDEPRKVIDHETLRHFVTGRHGSTERRKRRQRRK
jgi:hypothetical protein